MAGNSDMRKLVKLREEVDVGSGRVMEGEGADR